MTKIFIISISKNWVVTVPKTWKKSLHSTKTCLHCNISQSWNIENMVFDIEVLYVGWDQK